MSHKKPSKQIFALMILAATAIICAFIFRFGIPFHKKATVEGQLVTPSNTAEGDIEIQKLADSDSDGLYDWEETLRNTDVHKSDTDNDGTNDGDEVKADRNPLIAGPNDATGEPTDNSTVNQPEDAINTKQTLSSEVSKNLLTRLMYLQQNDQLTPENKAALVKELTTFTTESFVYKKYTKESMLLLENPTPEEIRVYASNFASIQIDLISNIANQGDAITNNILVLSQLYSTAAKRLSEIAIPKVVADIHVSVVNNYSVVSKALEAFQDDSDPAKKAISIGAYQNAEANQEQSMSILANYFEQSGILFTSDQVGDYWNNF